MMVDNTAYTNGDTWYDDEAWNEIKMRLKHYLLSSLEKNLINAKIM